MASTPSQLLIVCPHCCHAMNEQANQLRCETCHVVYALPVWQDSAEADGTRHDRDPAFV